MPTSTLRPRGVEAIVSPAMRPPSRPTRSQLLLAASFATALALTGCGHPATQAECEELFTKSADIELRAQPNNTDAQKIAEQIKAARASERGAEFMNRCVGRRITERALTCVRQATTAEQMDRCL